MSSTCVAGKFGSARKNSKRKCALTGRNVGYLNLEALRSPRPLKFGFRPKQFYLPDSARMIRRAFSHGLDQNLSFGRPAQSDGVDRLALGSESDVGVVELELRE